MYHGSRLAPKGFTHVHHLYTRRALHVLGAMWNLANDCQDPSVQRLLKLLVQHQSVNASLRNSYRPESSFGNRAITGVYYVSSMPAEANALSLMRGTARRIGAVARVGWRPASGNALV